ncbi:purine nucleoside phosphorylase-like [Ctenocephalides felis]|uniref:purine nucleoside phosphorylase-like n=1 Tax=Ctenocephalides felis TaxID=7515 RepID=UPI000E6E1B4C|nr:purine nucleoside phosphorylase-like [Ctenocephalides felis]XP_026471029.1 purine nucleoside phosphorylase-like [Ctenocephalides felis]
MSFCENNNYTVDECSYERIKETTEFLIQKTKYRPKIGIICGSGIGPLADNLQNADSFDYSQIPNFPVSTVPGHKGRLVFGTLGGIEVLCMQGRFHYYEGYSLNKCCFPVRVMKLLGITHLIATNAAGGLNPNYEVGDIMIVRDHINLMGFAGNNPLVGQNDDRFGTRFPPMSRAYCRNMINIAKKIAAEMKLGKRVHEGVYTCLGGPNFETVAELCMLKAVGVDAVGMSTVHEVLVARHSDMTVFAFSLITNKCSTSYATEEEANHEEVMDVGKTSAPILCDFATRIVKQISKISG